MQDRFKMPLLYSKYADWWHLFSSVTDYQTEAEYYTELLLSHSTYPPQTVLELGCGGGNNAFYLKKRFQMTLVDRSPDMLEQSRKINPVCKHILGDMRDFRDDSLYDAVFIQDAIMYMTSEIDLQAAIDTAFRHCKQGGVALFVPDFTREEFSETTSTGGSDNGVRGVRYVEWSWDDDPTDDLFRCDIAYLFRNPDGTIVSDYDYHRLGFFTRATWLQSLSRAGFSPLALPNVKLPETEKRTTLFLGKK